MEKLYNKTEKIIRLAEIIFILMFMTAGFLQYSSLTFGESIISVVQWPTVALGGILLVYRLLFIKNYIKTAGIWLLGGFMISFLIAMAATFKYGYYDNLRGFIFMAFEFCILYASSVKEDRQSANKKYKIAVYYYIIAMALLSLLSIVLMFCGVSEVFESDVGPNYVIGFAWGRLFGAYWDPNIAAAMATIATIISIHLFIQTDKKGLKALYVINCVLQTVYVTFSDSRTGRVTLCVSVTLYLFIRFAKNGFDKLRDRKKVRVLCVAAATVAVMLVTAVLPALIRDGYNAGATFIYETFSGGEEGGHKRLLKIASGGRSDDVNSDISNRRFDIWKSAVEIFETKPVTGISHFNIIAYTEDVLPNSYVVNNDHMKFGTMHNVFFDILASQGILGIVTMGGAAVWIVVFLIKKRKNFFVDGDDNALRLSVTVTTMVSAMFMTEIAFVISPLTLLFWINTGSLVKSVTDR